MIYNLLTTKELTVDSPLSEHLRPREIDDLTLDETIKKRFMKMKQQKKIMNMMFYGKAGTGKSTAAMLIADPKDYDISYFDLSRTNSIEFIRSHIIGSASSNSLYAQKRLLILDEADGMMSSNQNALKVTIEMFADTCRFILITNNPDKIIGPIQSRLKSINFDQIPGKAPKLLDTHISKILKKIEAKHGELNQEQVEEITQVARVKFPDYRAIAVELEFAGY